MVHNGIIENAAALKTELKARGVVFRSETDTEVFAHMIAASEAETLEEAVRQTLLRVQGAYGLAVMSADEPDPHRRGAQRQSGDPRPGQP